MSGSTGAHRIKKADVQPTIDHYIKNILSKWPGWGGKYAYTGSYVVGKKSDYGDVDIVILANGSDKKAAKKEFQKWLDDNFSDRPDLLMPFVSQKYGGILHKNMGELVTIHYPQKGKDYGAQIDNMFAMTEDEFAFKQEFLNLPAETQGLILGLVKIATIENKPEDLFKKLGISVDPELPEGYEWEFNLSGKELQLRKVHLDKNYKQLGRTIEWKSDTWQDVKTLISPYPINAGFKTLLNMASKNLKNQRSGKRMVGIFKSMISVKSGEVGTEKGMNKLRAIADVEKTLGESKTYFLKFEQLFERKNKINKTK